MKKCRIPPPQTSSGENSRRKLQNVVTNSTAEQALVMEILKEASQGNW